MRKFYVYVHTCKANGKKYVGITTAPRPELRWREGKGYRYNKHFYSAILKHGWDNFEHEAWELTSESEMYYAEKYLIAYYHTTESKFGYNHSSGGEKGASGCIRSEEFRRKLSETQKKRCLDPEVRRKKSEVAKKVHSDLEVRRKMSLSHKGKSLEEEHRKRIAENNRRKAKDPEFRKRLSEACKNKPKIKIKLLDGTVLETTKNIIVRDYVNKNKAFEYVS